MTYTIYKLLNQHHIGLSGGYVLSYDYTDTIIRFFHTFKGRVMGTEGHFFEYKSSDPIPITASSFNSKAEIAALLGLHDLIGFLPTEHKVNLELYQDLKRYVEKWLLTEYGIKINLVKWRDEESEKLVEIHHNLSVANKTGLAFGPWVADIFKSRYKAWLREAKPKVIITD